MSNSIFTRPGFWVFVSGLATGLFVKSKACRKVCVNTMAAGMIAKDKSAEGAANLKDEAMDIYEEAKTKKAAAQQGEEA